MGVGFSHGNASWSYTGFDFFRTKLAASVGINLDEMFGHGGDKQWTYADDIESFDSQGIQIDDAAGYFFGKSLAACIGQLTERVLQQKADRKGA
jgi:hypothetical protein